MVLLQAEGVLHPMCGSVSQESTSLPNEDKGILSSGFELVTRHQRILWCVFAANFVLGGLGASGAARALGRALHHSLAGEKLANGFDLGMFMELVSQPEVKLFSHSMPVFIFAGLYFLFLLFVMPGIVAVYLEDRRFTTGEFCGAAGEYFWAFVRLALWSLIPFFIVHFLQRLVSEFSHYVGDRVAWDPAGFVILVIGSIPFILAFVWVRMWFDLAQVRAVARHDRRTGRNVAGSLRIAIRSSWRAYWAYLVICILVSVMTGIAMLIWARVPARAVPVTFVLLELVMLVHIFGRLWQKGCITTWYKMNPEPVVAAPEPPPFEPGTWGVNSTSSVLLDVDTPLTPEVEPVPEPPVKAPSLGAVRNTGPG
jgi:hypothetical protein